MAVKTITIDLEAYEILARRKRAGQSFSQVIKEQLGRRVTGADLLELMPHVALSEDALEAVEAQIKRRARDRPKAPRL